MIRVLLDEGVPNPLAGWLQVEGADATPFPNAWKALDDKSLLRRASDVGYDVLVTNDRNMPYQQVVTGLPMAVLVLPNLRLVDAQGLAPHIAAILPSPPKAAFTILRPDGRAVRFDPPAPKS